MNTRGDGAPLGCMAVGYDRSDGARRAASWAAALLQPDGKLVIVHALRPLHGPPSPLASYEERLELGRAVVDELLLESDDSMRQLDLATEVLDEDPVHALIDAAARHRADAIVVGSEHHSPLHKALGVVTSELIASSPVPVIAVPPERNG